MDKFTNKSEAASAGQARAGQYISSLSGVDLVAKKFSRVIKSQGAEKAEILAELNGAIVSSFDDIRDNICYQIELDNASAFVIFNPKNGLWGAYRTEDKAWVDF